MRSANRPPLTPRCSSADTIGPRRWSGDEYMKLAESGYFAGERVELISGEIISMSPQGNYHTIVTTIAQQRLDRLFGGLGFSICQSTYHTDDDATKPEPDLQVLPGKPQDYLDTPPTERLLVVEVSHTTLRHDRGTKLKTYARLGVPEYWILNLNTQQLEVHRHPEQDRTDGWTYRDRNVFGSDDTVTPLKARDQILTVKELFG